MVRYTKVRHGKALRPSVHLHTQEQLDIAEKAQRKLRMCVDASSAWTIIKPHFHMKFAESYVPPPPSKMASHFRPPLRMGWSICIWCCTMLYRIQVRGVERASHANLGPLANLDDLSRIWMGSPKPSHVQIPSDAYSTWRRAALEIVVPGTT